MCCVELALRGVASPASAVKGRQLGLLLLFLPDGYAMLMRPNKAETAAYGFYCRGDMAGRMCAG